tara:strand:- start:1612 stop:1860 length:249 start_codon:yes stop_codon:yes gene_type:complete
MNRKRSKALKKRSRELVLEWLQGLVSDEEKDRITLDNLEQFLPEETHYFAAGSTRCYAMSPRYVYQQLKKNPDATVKELAHA